MHLNPYRSLPAVNQILETAPVQALVVAFPHHHIINTIRHELDERRRMLAEGAPGDGCADVAAIAESVAARLQRAFLPRLRPVINATGIILHTNLGRAPLAEQAAQAAHDAARGYLNLEIDLETGNRSSRQVAIRDWVRQLTGAESATVVNNNAAATVIALRALCQGKEVVISRGQLIEIGGSFRIPEIMGVSGAILKEVGTTNITRLADYENAIGVNTGALLNVHTSNYRVSGFTASVPLADLVTLGQKHGLKVIDDIGSGAMIDFARFGFQGEPVAGASIAAGVDLALFSGDKLLGGPQAGILAGKATCIQAIEKDPLMRAFRCDKMTLAALEATLRLYLDEERALREVPTLRMLAAPLAELRKRAHALAEQLWRLKGLTSVEVSEDDAYVGGGSLPDQALVTCVVEISAHDVGDAELARRLRLGNPAVLARVRDGKVVLDMRTVNDRQQADLVDAVHAALEKNEPR